MQAILVTAQVRLLKELLVTLIAVKRTFAQMHGLDMAVEMSGMSERFVAFRTCIHLPLLMHGVEVSLLVAAQSKELRTLGTRQS